MNLAGRRKTFQEEADEALAALPKTGFRVADLRGKLTRQGLRPGDADLKSFRSRMIRIGKVVVVEAGETGGGGSRYGHTPAPAAVEESPTAAAKRAPFPAEKPAVSGEICSVSAEFHAVSAEMTTFFAVSPPCIAVSQVGITVSQAVETVLQAGITVSLA